MVRDVTGYVVFPIRSVGLALAPLILTAATADGPLQARELRRARTDRVSQGRVCGSPGTMGGSRVGPTPLLLAKRLQWVCRSRAYGWHQGGDHADAEQCCPCRSERNGIQRADIEEKR